MLYKLNRPHEAIEMFEKTININSSCAEAFNNKGIKNKSKIGYIYQHDLSKLEDAMMLFKMAISINSKYCEAYFNLGKIYIYSKELCICKKAIIRMLWKCLIRH